MLEHSLRRLQGAMRLETINEPVAGMQLRMLDVVFSGLRETAVEDLGRLARLDGMSFELTERGRRLKHELKKTFGERALAVLTAGGPIGDIEKLLGDRVQARIAIDSMLMCDALVAKGGVQLGLGQTAPSARRKTPIELMPDPPSAPAGDEGEELFALLFDGELGPDDHKPGEAPLSFDDAVEHIAPEDSGVVSPEDVQATINARSAAMAARQAIIAEHQRIQSADHYAVLLIDRDANNEDIEAGYQIKVALLERKTKDVTDPQDRVKLDEIFAAYATARAVLSEPQKRAAYNREMAGGELVTGPPAIDTELNFRMAEELMMKKQWEQALGLLKTVIARAPNEADYHAALGWASWNAMESHASAADV